MGLESPDSESRRLLEAATGLSYMQMLAAGEIAGSAVDEALALARRRAAGEPLQYVMGLAGFRHLELDIGPGVLIPRPETEIVAEQALSRLAPGATVVDVCTGSGAIALAIAHERPDARVLATDSSPAALQWAKRNRARLGSNVEFIRCDLLTGLPARLLATVDVIVANPPYVSSSEMADLPSDIVDFEPHEALFGGSQGLDVAVRIAAQARDWLRHGGWLVMEIGAAQGEAATGMLQHDGYESVAIVPDLAGRPRVVEGRRP